jgi:hypothetical protein
MGIQPFYIKGSHILPWAGLWAAHGQIAVSGIPDGLNYCVIFTV